MDEGKEEKLRCEIAQKGECGYTSCMHFKPHVSFEGWTEFHCETTSVCKITGELRYCNEFLGDGNEQSKS
jgi:hypothetical protein